MYLAHDKGVVPTQGNSYRLVLLDEHPTGKCGRNSSFVWESQPWQTTKSTCVVRRKANLELSLNSEVGQGGLYYYLQNGEGVLTNSEGNVVTRAPLSSKDLYEFDILELFSYVQTVRR